MCQEELKKAKKAKKAKKSKKANQLTKAYKQLVKEYRKIGREYMGVIAEYKKVVEFLEQKANFDPFSTGFGTTSQDDFLGEYQQLPDEDLGSSDVDYWKSEEEAGECKARQKSAGISEEDFGTSDEEADIADI